MGCVFQPGLDAGGKTEEHDGAGAGEAPADGEPAAATAPFAGVSYPLESRLGAWGSEAQQEAMAWYQRSGVCVSIAVDSTNTNTNTDTNTDADGAAAQADAEDGKEGEAKAGGEDGSGDSKADDAPFSACDTASPPAGPLSPEQVFGAADVALEGVAAAKSASVAAAARAAVHQAALAAAVEEFTAAARAEAAEAGEELPEELPEEVVARVAEQAEARVAAAAAAEAAAKEEEAKAAAAVPTDWSARLRAVASGSALVDGVRRRVARGEQGVDVEMGQDLLKRWNDVDHQWTKRVHTILACLREEQVRTELAPPRCFQRVGCVCLVVWCVCDGVKDNPSSPHVVRCCRASPGVHDVPPPIGAACLSVLPSTPVAGTWHSHGHVVVRSHGARKPPPSPQGASARGRRGSPRGPPSNSCEMEVKFMVVT